MKIHAAVAAAVAICAGTASAQIEYTLDKRGMPLVTLDGKHLFKCETPFWGANWKWVGLNTRRRDGAGDVFGLAAPQLNLTGTAAWALRDTGGMSCTFTLDVARATNPAIGGGIEFRPAVGDALFGGHDTPPALLGNRGWEWRIGDGRRVRVTFEPELPSVYFERGNKGIIRCLFYSGSFPAGSRTVTMRIDLPGDSRRVLSLAERYGDADTSRWLRDVLHPTESFVDLSGLNHRPAGKFGFVRTRGDAFVLGNGQPIRFWGCNVQAYSLFAENRELIAAHARRIAKLGFNLVRLHHHDSQIWVEKCLLAMGPTSRALDQEALDTYFYWIKCLRDEGIYLWIDLHVERPFRQGDGVPHFAELLAKSKRKEVGVEVKGYCYVNERIKELMKEFNRKLVTTVNPHTGLALKDDPAVMTFMLTNENDLTHHFGNALLADKQVPGHHALFRQRVAEFAKRTGLPQHELEQTWLPGASKLLLNDMEYRWNVDMIRYLRGLGVRQPIDTGQMWGGTPLFSVPALTAGDMIDVHTYSHGEFLLRSPRGAASFADTIARAQVLGKPLTVTEWNVEDGSGARDAFVMPILIAAMGAFQGWDAPMLYGYSQDALGGDKLSAWSSHNIPNIIGMMPAAALLFRGGHVRPAIKTVAVQLSRDSCLLRGSGEPEAVFRTLSLKHRVALALPGIAELPWLKPSPIPAGAVVVTDLDRDFVPPGATALESDTGELRRDWKQGLLTIDTPKTQGAIGWLKGRPLGLRDVGINVQTPKAAVVVTSLDGKPIPDSGRLLVTALARMSKERADWREVAVSEPVTGLLGIRSKLPGLRLVPLAGDGTEMAAVRGTPVKGGFRFELSADAGSHWFLIKP